MGLLKTLALVACDLTGVIPDNDLVEVERLGQNKLYNPLERVYKQEKKITGSGSKAPVRAGKLKELWLQCYPGGPGLWESAAPTPSAQLEQGRTPVGSVSGPKRKRAALPLTIPRLVDGEVGRWHVSMENELQHVHDWACGGPSS